MPPAGSCQNLQMRTVVMLSVLRFRQELRQTILKFNSMEDHHNAIEFYQLHVYISITCIYIYYMYLYLLHASISITCIYIYYMYLYLLHVSISITCIYIYYMYLYLFCPWINITYTIPIIKTALKPISNSNRFKVKSFVDNFFILVPFLTQLTTPVPWYAIQNLEACQKNINELEKCKRSHQLTSSILD